MDKWQTPISYLKGVGPERAKVLQQELNIENFYDLLHFFPFRYLDKSQFFKIYDLHPELEDAVQIEGKIIQIKENNLGKKPFLQVVLQDQTGKIQLIWFQFYKILLKKFQVGQTWIVYGKVKFNNGIAQISHPELSEKSSLAWEPVYSSTQIATRKGLDSKGIQKLQKELFSLSLTIPEIFPETWIKKLNFISRSEAYQKIHFPKNAIEHQQAMQRLKFEELFFLQWIIHQQRKKNSSLGFSFEKVGHFFNFFYKNYLPFELTEAQKKVLKEIRKDLASGLQMNRLLQGDVGAGKTIVAFLSLLLALDNGFQGLLLAPTEILAQQHYQNFKKLLEKPVSEKLNLVKKSESEFEKNQSENLLEKDKNLDLKIDFLSGSLTKKEKKLCLENLSDGKTQILVGTHALLEEPVIFRNLGLAIVDEQHRFGVKQRAALWKKNLIPPHILVMTATPIPRTLAMTLYGDLSISILDQRPKGRQKIQTFHVTEKKRLQVFGLMEREIAKGRQIYIVYPMIDENEKLDYQNLMEGYNSITRHFPAPKYQVSVVHGRMKGEEKNYEMQRFLRQETQIMVATTVIEVGVDVPNATVMLIENAERFGLAQLHQLRGRVGRGSEISYCLLMSKEKISRESLTRMQTLVNSDNGFEIAQVDLQLRGHGDLMGTEQSGNFAFRIANLSTDVQILEKAKKAVEFLSTIDPNLEQFSELKKEIFNLQIRKPNWGKIS